MFEFFKSQEAKNFLTLSCLMSNAMEFRHQSHRFSSASTFRPPPRVTLTEQKKEAWLRDLANSNVPLRKLSRTIPHGTRNRTLLEQCCSKAVPIPRAVWFARCVGANELRGLKRKGASGIPSTAFGTTSAATMASEATWIREWTEQVTEYIEKIIKDHNILGVQQHAQNAVNKSNNTAASPTSLNDISDARSVSSSPRVTQNYASPIPGQSPRPTIVSSTQQQQPQPVTSHNQIPWKNRLEYMLRLSEHLYSEDLLDKNAFLKWCISFFDNCKIYELPAALLFLRAFWTNILRSPNLSQTLALALLRHYSALNGGKSTTSTSVVTSYLPEPSANRSTNHPLSPALINHPVIVEIRQKLARYIRILFIYSPDTFVIPNYWQSLGPVLGSILKSNSSAVKNNNTNLNDTRPQFLEDLSSIPELSDLYAFIATRNENLIISDSAHVRALRHPAFLVIDALDKANIPFNWEPVSQAILSNKMSSSHALHTAYVWATTTSRTGSERVYACVALVAYWAQTFDWDLSSTFVDFLLNTVTTTENFTMSNVYDLLTEFLDRDWFCISTYVRRLISSGVLFIPRMRQLVQAQIQIVANLPAQFVSENLRNQQVILLNSVGVTCLKDEPQQLQQLSEQLYEILDFLSPDYQVPVVKSDLKEYEKSSMEKEYMEISGETCAQIAELTKGGQLELSTWISNLFFQKVESTTAGPFESSKSNEDENAMEVDEKPNEKNEFKDPNATKLSKTAKQIGQQPFVPTISQFSLLQNLFEILHDPKSLYRVIESMIPNVTQTALLGFICNCVRDHILVFSALADISQIIVKLVIQFKSLGTKTKMPKGLWDLATYALYHLDCTSLVFEISRNTGSENQSPASSFNLRTELEALVKTGPDQNASNSAVGLGIGSTGSAGKVAQDLSALSPISDSLFGKESNDCLLDASGLSSGNLNLNTFFTKPIEPHDIPIFFQEISDRFLNVCQSESFVSIFPGSRGSENSMTMSNEAETSARELRAYSKALVKLRDTDVDLFTSLLTTWIRDKCFPRNNRLNPVSANLDLTSQQKVEKDTQVLTRVLLFLITYECISFEKAVEIFLAPKTTSSELKESTTAFEEGNLNNPSMGVVNQSSRSGSAAPSPKVTSSGFMTVPTTASIGPVKPLKIILNLVSLKFIDTGIILKASEKLALNMYRRIFERTHADIFAKCIVREILEAAGVDDESAINSHSQSSNITHTMLFQHHLNLLHQQQNQQNSDKKELASSLVMSNPDSSSDQSEPLQRIFDETDSCFSTVSSFLLWLSIADISTFIDSFISPIIQSGNKTAIEVSKSITAYLLKLPPPETLPPLSFANNSRNICTSPAAMVIKEEITRIASICNDFNIHLCQVHLRTTLQTLQMGPRQTEDQFSNSVAEVMLDLIFGRFTKNTGTTLANTGINPSSSSTNPTRLEDKFPSTRPISPRVFGDLTVHLSKKLKSKLLYKAELMFLNSPSFFYSMKKSAPKKDKLYTDSYGKDGDEALGTQSQGDLQGVEKSESEKDTDDLEEEDEPDAITYLLEILDAVSDSVEVQLFSVNAKEFISCFTHILMLTEDFEKIDQGVSTQCIIPENKTVRSKTLTNAILLIGKIIMIHSSTLSSTQEYSLVFNRLQNGLARLLNTQFVQTKSSFLFGLLFDILNTLRGPAFDNGTEKTANGDEDATMSLGFRSANGSSGQTPGASVTSSASSPVNTSQFARGNSPAYWPQQKPQQPPQQSGTSPHALQQNSFSSASGFPLGSKNASHGPNLASNHNDTNAVSLNNSGTPLLSTSSSSTNALLASVSAYQRTIQLSQQRTSIGSEAVSRISMLRDSIVASMKRDDIAGHGSEAESYFTNLAVRNNQTGDSTTNLASMGIRSFDMLEEPSYKMGPNDTPISLAMFDGYADKRNP